MADNMMSYPQSKAVASTKAVRSLLDQLLTSSRLYTKSQDYKDLLDFAVRLRNFAPFNAMILQLQKPGLMYAASSRDWRERFARYPKEGARPLIILWPFGPVALVYDVVDTEGKPLPQDVASFFATGPIDHRRLAMCRRRMEQKQIRWVAIDAGDGKAGSIRVVERAKDKKTPTIYCVQVNKNHSYAVQFVTIAHELAHLFLGHLGPDKPLSVPKRARMDHDQRELEAESVAYLVCERNGVTSRSATYLANYVTKHTALGSIDIYQVMRAAGQIEALLGLTAHTRYDLPESGQS